MRVKADTEAGKLAGPIAGTIRCGEDAVLECIGAGSIYQAVKSICIAGGFVKDEGINLLTDIATEDKTIKNKEVTAFILTVKGVKR